MALCKLDYTLTVMGGRGGSKHERSYQDRHRRVDL
jgi:hypothetical protein